ncbi:hypothetical protein [Streptomyces sp. RKAG337]|uniref:hypothetical protein n=1 Tax=Streptomyces sp. RKAG337 TaxID=2893404 RepID=UPI002033675E|nr:hypothetical protein [Streptomyces sp. RKAG337]MCM2431060.1 hypothetical protein [Streptomyces sp. RKAG337]
MDATDENQDAGAPIDLSTAVGTLARFLHRQPLTQAIAGLEHRLEGADASSAARATAEAGVDEDLLASALTVRESLGRINDLIHASGILLVLPHILEPGEKIINRPSLGPGTIRADPSTWRPTSGWRSSNWPGGAVPTPPANARPSRTW